MRTLLEKPQILVQNSAYTSFPQEKVFSQVKSGSAVSTTESLSHKQTSVEISLSYQVQPGPLNSIGFSCDLSQQALNGSVAIGTIVAITLFVRAFEPLIKAFRA